jgi:FAD/FMN-containing dehydrogenase
VKACRAHGASIVTQGGNTGLVGGSVPDASGRQVVLSTARLSRIRSIDAANLTLVAEAGCVLQRVQDAAAEHGLLFALSLAAEGSCTIGGNLATNAGGTQVVRYGNARELCLGVVTAEGASGMDCRACARKHRLRPARPPDRQRRCHHRGDAEAHPRPAAVATAMARCGRSPRRLLLRSHQRLRPGLTGFEI